MNKMFSLQIRIPNSDVLLLKKKKVKETKSEALKKKKTLNRENYFISLSQVFMKSSQITVSLIFEKRNGDQAIG